MAETRFDEWVAERYERLWPQLFSPAVVEPTVDCLHELAGSGRCLEFGIGTGRIAIPLSRRGVTVHGIELSEAMVRRLRGQPGSEAVGVTIGDFATTAVGGVFSLVYLLRNTITNLTTQHEQVNCFHNAAAHLAPGGLFLIENYIPQLQRLPSEESVHVFAAEPDHLAFETYNRADQIAVSTHYWVIDGELKTFSSPHRYVWPHDLDRMAKVAGLTLRYRWSDWHRHAFTSDSSDHISVWQKAPTGSVRERHRLIDRRRFSAFREGVSVRDALDSDPYARLTRDVPTARNDGCARTSRQMSAFERALARNARSGRIDGMAGPSRTAVRRCFGG